MNHLSKFESYISRYLKEYSILYTKKSHKIETINDIISSYGGECQDRYTDTSFVINLPYEKAILIAEDYPEFFSGCSKIEITFEEIEYKIDEIILNLNSLRESIKNDRFGNLKLPENWNRHLNKISKDIISLKK